VEAWPYILVLFIIEISQKLPLILNLFRSLRKRPRNDIRIVFDLAENDEQTIFSQGIKYKISNDSRDTRTFIQ